MNKELYVSSTPHETKVALVEDDALAEVYFERENEYTLAGSIYKGRVTRVLPGMQSAFVDIGLERDAFLYVSDFLDLEEDEDEDEDDFGDVKVTGQTLALANGFVASQSKAEEAIAEEPVEKTPEAAEAAGEEDAEGGSRRWRGRRRRGRRGGRERAGRTEGETPSTEAVIEETESFEEEFPVEAIETEAAEENFEEETSLPPSTIEAASDESFEEEEVEEPEVKAEIKAESKPAAAAYEPILLPGESISKYKNGYVPGSEELSSEEEPEGGEEPRREFRGRGDRRERDRGRGRGRERDRRDRGGDRYERGERREHTPREPEAPLPDNYMPIVLPGESISKYRGVTPIEMFEEENEPLESREPLEEAADDVLVEETPEIEPSAEESEEPKSHASVDAPKDPGFRFPWSHGGKEKGEEVGEAPVEEPVAESAAVEEKSSRPQGRNGRRGRGRRGGASRGGRVVHEEIEGDESAEPSLRQSLSRLQTDEEGELSETVREHEQQRTLDEYEFEESDEFEEKEVTTRPAGTPAEEPRGRRRERGERRERSDRGDRGDRGERGDRRGGRRPHREPRIIPQISDVLKEGQEILVQIAKEPIGKKGARITSHIALPGRFLVYMPTVNHVGVSRKINSDEERQRLKRIVVSERENGHGGFIVRTAAANIDEEELRADIRFLKHLWHEIRTRSESSKSPALIYHDLNLVERVLRDQVTSDFSQIWVDTQEEYERVVRFASRFQPNLVKRIKLYTKQTPLFEQFGLTEEINKALKAKVWLKSGGYLVINQTEALVAIDINTGKYVGKTSRLEDTIVKTNIEACREIVRQIRLRDMGGIIVIDFIDMDERKNRAKVMSALEEAMKSDRAPSKILQFNDFGLVAVTRKRVKQSLERTLGSACPYCSATGIVKSVTTVCNDIYVEFRKIRNHIESKDVTLRVNPEVAKELKTQNGRRISELEELTGHPVIVKSDQLVHMEQFDINF
jgi:ribonuclease G